MKNLIWLTVAVLLQSVSVKAREKHMAQPFQLPSIHKQVMCLSLDEGAHFTGEIKPFLRFNMLTIKPTAQGILFNWMVEETTNLQYFLIEHAVDGQNFSPLYEVPVQLNQHEYSFVDAGVKAFDKPVYYRVKAIYPTVVIESPVRKIVQQTAKR
jgi:hypothetical protein